MNEFFKPTDQELDYLGKLSDAFDEEYVLIRLTETMCAKSIIDAGESLRVLLKRNGIASYEAIGQGEKIMKEALIFTGEEIVERKVSYYRPRTKSGDPRFWVYGLNDNASKGQLLFFTVLNDLLLCLPLEFSDEQSETYLNYIKKYSGKDDVLELLKEKLSQIKQSGWLISVSPDTDAPKDVGETLEAYMGVEVNNLRTPDFMGKIELKSKRSKAKTMDSLFSKVPDWDISKLKSVLAIVDRYGYLNEDWPMKRLYNDISSKPNAQGLYSFPNDNDNILYQKYTKDDLEEDVCAWRYSTIREALIEKHPTTLWVGAQTQIIEGKFHFKYSTFELSTRPNFSEFIRLIWEDKVVYDWKAKIKLNGTSVRNHGPGFRMKPRDRGLLFHSLIKL